MPEVATTIDEVRRSIRRARVRHEGSIGFVPTMGALHEGHLALVRHARERSGFVVVSIFVNPLQFGEKRDLDRYPRDLDADLALLDTVGVDLVFAPTAAEMYPDGPSSTRVVAGPVGSLFEGRSRPGHFDGVLTVVAKLFHIVRPDVAFFGQKDAQQVFLVSRMVKDLDLDVAIDVVPTVRESDGLALSSRNRFLEGEERGSASLLHAMLDAAGSASDAGVDAMIAAAQSAAMGERDVEVDYLAIVNPDTFTPVDDDFRGRALVIVAARVGAVRLIDNLPVTVSR